MKHKLTFSSLPLLALFLALAPIAQASTTWYVDGVHGNNSNNCMSSLTACKTIGHAISLASSGDSIMVAGATYYEHLTIRFSLRIIGSGATTTIIDGRRVARVVTIPNASASVTLSRVTVRNGLARTGGGIYNAGILTITTSIISGNQAQGNIEHFANGGGIYNTGTLAIRTSTVSGNSLHFGEGGGIINSTGTTTISNSTISGNDGFLRGGGIKITFGTVTITNSTVARNTASSGHGGGIENLYGAAVINNSTISANSSWHSAGGIENVGGTFTFQNSIVANNSGANCLNAATWTSKGYNMSSDGTCNFHSSGDRNNIDPKLGPLQNNGGPTQTQALLPGSPAIDAGNPSGCTDAKGHLLTTGQRGYPRPDREDTGGCDMGAYEKQSD
jgi:hypothetical protein